MVNGVSHDGGGTSKSPFTFVLPDIRPSRIKRRHLRKYSWLPDVFRLKGSVISRIIGPVLTITIWGVGIVYAQQQGVKMVQTNSIVPLLSVVVGLLLVFRNGTSYDRFWEGRKTFASLTSNIRSLSRNIWVTAALPPTSIPPEYVKGKTPQTTLDPVQLHQRKVEFLKLSVSFVFAVKHYLRGEDGIHYDDLLSVLPARFVQFEEHGFNTRATERKTEPRSYSSMSQDSGRSGEGEGRSGTSTPNNAKPDATKRVRPKRSKQQVANANTNTPLLSKDRHHAVHFSEQISMPLPLMIAHEMTRTIFCLRKEGFLETIGPAGTNAMLQTVSTMVDQVTSMERIANTPIPASYGIHLKQCVTLYLFALPLSLVNDLNWAMVPIVTIVAFTFMGIEGIAEEIENPFGLDGQDLPLDRYCQDLKEEILFTIEKLPEEAEGIHGYDNGEGDD